MRARRNALIAGSIIGVGGVAVATSLPWLPLGTDLYVHVVWPWQVMRCLSQGALPVWLPELNAGFGSPGISLYSPAAPLICGVLGLLFGTVSRGLRAALMVALVALAIVAPGRDRRWRFATTILIVLSPALVIEFFGRFPVAQLLSVPVAMVLLQRAVESQWSPHKDGVLLALLWLLHAPTALMVGGIAAIAPFIGPAPEAATGSSGNRWIVVPRVEALRTFCSAVVTAAALTAWHWWPLLANAASFSFRSALTGGEQDPLRNLIGVAQPHLSEINVAMGWAAVGLLAAILVVGGWRARDGKLAILAVFLSTSLSTVIWQYVTPLSWINFPWRWLLPATLLTVPLVVRADGVEGRGRRWLAIAFLVLPLLAAPTPVLAPDPGLTAGTEPHEAGRRVAQSFGGNPLLVDVKEHRPVWWESLAPTLEVIGVHHGVVMPEGGVVRVVAWQPLRRVLSVTAPQPATVVVRLLADEHWWARVNGEAVIPQRWGAAIAVPVPPGHSTLELAWSADWQAVLGAVIALAAFGWVVLVSARRRQVNGVSPS